MARAKTLELLDPRPVSPPQPKLKKCCGTCRDWKVSHMRKTVGQCMPGSGLAPLITTDLQSCSDHVFKEGLA